MEKIPRTISQIAAQLEKWFLHYHGEEKNAFDGTETFTIFNLLQNKLQNEVLAKLKLPANEFPILVLKIQPGNFIINTTERFIQLEYGHLQSLYYTDFNGHFGYLKYASLNNSKELVNIKSEGSFESFGLKKNDDSIIYWTIPTGRPGFSFWKVTDRCEVIGRRYIITNQEQ